MNRALSLLVTQLILSTQAALSISSCGDGPTPPPRIRSFIDISNMPTPATTPRTIRFRKVVAPDVRGRDMFWIGLALW
jgi:hypothetical protein